MLFARRTTLLAASAFAVLLGVALESASALNPQPLPPKDIRVLGPNRAGPVLLNPQPLPPRVRSYRWRLRNVT
jgi:hypothetical protein